LHASEEGQRRADGTLPAELRAAIMAAIHEDRVRVPPFPSVASELNALIQKKPSIAEISKVVSRDQTLSAAVLRLANSAALSGGRTLTTVPTALMRIGVNELVVLAFATAMRLEATQAGPLHELRRVLWHRGLSASIVCRDLAAQSGSLQPDTALLCGLLYDFGKIVAVAAVEMAISAYPSFFRLTTEEWLRAIAELHRELGIVIAERWNLPSPISDVVACRAPNSLTGLAREAAELVSLAELVLTDLFRPGSAEATAMAMLNGETPYDANKVLQKLPEQVAGLMTAIDLPVENGRGQSAVFRPPLETLSAESLPGEPTTCTLQVTDLKHVVESLTTTSLRIKSSRPLAESFVTRATLERTPRKIEFFVTVTSCRESNGSYTIELQPFCIQGEKMRHLADFIAGANRRPTASVLGTH
jgi:HD-like signal output (HDOD) protein